MLHSSTPGREPATRVRTAWRTVAVIGAVVLIAGACGGAGNTDDEYFESVGEATRTLADRLNGLPGVGLASSLDDVRAFFDVVGDALDATLDQLSGVSVPEDAADAHGPFLASIDRFAALTAQITEAVAGLDSPDDFASLATDSNLGIETYGAAGRSILVTCWDLQHIATESEIAIDIGCSHLRRFA